MSRDLIFSESSKHFHPLPLTSLLCSNSLLPVHGGVRRVSPGDPCHHTTPHHKPGEQDSMLCPRLYLHIGLLCVHQLLDDFSEAIRIRQVAGQGPRRWVLALPRSFHAGGLGGVKTPTQRSDLFGTLRGDKSGKCTGDCPLLSTAQQGHNQCLHPHLGSSWADGCIRCKPLYHLRCRQGRSELARFSIST